jgi:hypothetical protein
MPNKKTKTAKPIKTAKSACPLNIGHKHEIKFDSGAKGHPRYTTMRIIEEVSRALPVITAKSEIRSGHVTTVTPHDPSAITVSMLTDSEANELVRVVNANLHAPVLRMPTLAYMQTLGKQKPTTLRNRHAKSVPALRMPTTADMHAFAKAITVTQKPTKPTKPVKAPGMTRKHTVSTKKKKVAPVRVVDTDHVQIQISVMHHGKEREIKQLPNLTIETLTERHQLAVEGDKNGTLDLVYAVTDGYGVKHYSESLNEIVENVLDMHVFSLKSGQPSPAMLRLTVSDARPNPMYCVPRDVVAVLTTVDYVIGKSGSRLYTTSGMAWRALPFPTRRMMLTNARTFIETVPVWFVIPSAQLSRVLRADMTLVNNDLFRSMLSWSLEHGDFFEDVEDIVSGALTAFAEKM